jgi:hypothetical protein
MKAKCRILLAAVLFLPGLTSMGAQDSSFYAHSAIDLGKPGPGGVRLGLFNWGQAPDGKMYASFYMENNGSRDISEVEITCNYRVIIPQYPVRGARLMARLRGINLASMMSGPEVLKAGRGRNYHGIYFGQLEPIAWVQEMTCAPTDAKY